MVNRLFLAFYFIELVTRLFVERSEFFHEHFNCIDFFVVIIDIISTSLICVADTIKLPSVVR